MKFVQQFCKCYYRKLLQSKENCFGLTKKGEKKLFYQKYFVFVIVNQQNNNNMQQFHFFLILNFKFG